MVVKAESEDGRRLHIDKDMLRGWWEDFARLMREQGIAANVTPRFVRGQNKGKTRDSIYRAQRRGDSTVVRQRVIDVVKHLGQTGSLQDPARERLVESRRALIRGGLDVAQALDLQGEVALAGEVRKFAEHLPRVLTDKERVAMALVQQLEQATRRNPTRDETPVRTSEITR